MLRECSSEVPSCVGQSFAFFRVGWPAATVLLLLSVVSATTRGADAPVVGVHDIELAPQADAAEFERFVSEKFAPAWRKARDGMRLGVMKGDRGRRKGMYQLVYFFESAEARDRHFPREGEGGSAAFTEAVQPVAELMREFVQYLGQSTYTDYVLLGTEGGSKTKRGPRVYGVHNIELRDDVDPADFDRFVQDTFAPAWDEPRDGLKLVIAKGDRGDRKDMYQLIYAFESVEARDRHFPSEDEGGSDAFINAVQPVVEVIQQYGQFVGRRTSYTDYVLLGGDRAR